MKSKEYNRGWNDARQSRKDTNRQALILTMIIVACVIVIVGIIRVLTGPSPYICQNQTVYIPLNAKLYIFQQGFEENTTQLIDIKTEMPYGLKYTFNNCTIKRGEII